MPKYKVANVVFDLLPIYAYTPNICKNYLCKNEQTPELIIKTTQQDIDAEKVGEVVYPDAYYESLSVFRKLCNYVLSKKDGIIFHSSAIMVDGKAYLFTAPSGTGKSTHTRLWRELLGDRAVMINDDKPIIRYEDNKFFVYGTPWNGKHGLDTNCRAEIKGICSIYQSKENVIRKADSSEMLPIILNQTLRPASVSDMDRLLGLIDKMLTQVSVYKLGCNISLEAAELSYKTMSGEAQ